MVLKKDLTTKLFWYWTRLSTMNPAEIQFRVAGLVRNQYEKRFKTGFQTNGKIKSFPTPILFESNPKCDFNTSEYSIFGTKLNIEEPINWHKDISNNGVFPMRFSRSINTRTEEHGIVKVVWEVNRLQFLTNICLQYQQTKDQKYLDQFVRIIQSWKAENPYLLGVNWYSNIEISLRIITWFLCWEILKVNDLCEKNSDFKAFVEQDWIPLIHLHAVYSHTHPSKFSSSNNHLIAEAAGLFIASTYWDFPESETWIKESKIILEREILLQHSENGINKEEASEYIQFITDFFLISMIVGERKGQVFSDAYKNRLHQIFNYISNLMTIKGDVPYYGDDDDGHTLILKRKIDCSNFQSLLISGTILFQDGNLKSKAGAFDLKNEILFGEKGQQLFDSIASTPDFQSKLYKEEGHIILKKADKSQEIYLHIDTAPLGYLSIAAHGHADALSFFLYLDGFPFIIDTGTYTYHSEPDWRAYFKGTLAHNTIRIDGKDQAQNGGPCLWSQHYESTLLKCFDNNDTAFVKATHTGYDAIGVQHIRSYFFDKKTDEIKVVDEIKSDENTEHEYEIPFHLHPKIEVTKQTDQRLILQHPQCNRWVEIQLDPNYIPQFIHGQEDPILGWNSPSFLQKEPTTTIYTKLKRQGNFTMTTLLKIVDR